MAASRNYGVLENEILIETFMNTCLEAGFADVRLHPIAHIVPLFELNRDQWRDWHAFTASQRPVRALHKMWRAALELAGLGKKDVLFEEAFAIRLLRELQPVIEQHPVVTAHRAPFVKPGQTVERAELTLVAAPAAASARGDVALNVRVVNAGTTAWDPGAATGAVRLGVQLLGSDGSVIDRNFARQPLPAVILPGSRCDLSVRVTMPSAAGSYQLKLDLVREGMRWFELAGSRAIVHRIEIETP